MKQVLIIIRPNMYFETKKALIAARFTSSSIINVLGRGKRTVEMELAAGVTQKDPYADRLVAKKMIEIYIRDEDEQKLIDTILKVNSTSNAGDGKIIVLPTSNCVRIHTGETGNDALE
jgi:Nitrogen regulatory protein PII